MATFDKERGGMFEWYSLLLDAKKLTGYQFNESLENYLLVTLDHYITKSNIGSSLIAIDLLKSTQMGCPRNGAQLREVGDQCLLLSGLFPERATGKNVSLSYLIGMGRQAYLALTDCRLREEFNPELYKDLSQNFIGLMDLLNAMRSTKR